MRNGISISLPSDMVFRKRYCSCCHTKLVKEKTIRIVTKKDKDYYEYHEHSTYPRVDYSVYSYIYKCPKCHKRFAVKEQKMIAILQKENNNYHVSNTQFHKNHDRIYRKVTKYDTIINIIIFSILILLTFTILYIFSDISKKRLFIIFSLIIILSPISNIKKKKNKQSHVNDYLVEYVYAKSFTNRDELEYVDNCFCFGCNTNLNTNEIYEYDKENSAICPYCGKKNIVPANSNIDEKIINEAHNYWY